MKEVILRHLVKIEDTDKEVWNLFETLAKSDIELSEKTSKELQRLLVIYPKERPKLIKTLKKVIQEGEKNA